MIIGDEFLYVFRAPPPAILTHESRGPLLSGSGNAYRSALFAVPLDYVMYAELDTLCVEWPIEIDGRAARIKFLA
jgi:hypothetical protein